MLIQVNKDLFPDRWWMRYNGQVVYTENSLPSLGRITGTEYAEITFIRNKSHGGDPERSPSKSHLEGFERREYNNKYRRRIYVELLCFLLQIRRGNSDTTIRSRWSRGTKSRFGAKFLKWQFEVNGQSVLTAQSTFTEDGTAFGFYACSMDTIGRNE